MFDVIGAAEIGARPAFLAELTPAPAPHRLPRRLRQIVEVVSDLGEAAASDVLDRVEVPLSSSAVRSMLQRLVAKGVLRNRVDGKRYLYRPAWSSPDLRETLLRRLAGSHFGGSLAEMAAELTRIISEGDSANIPDEGFAARRQ